MPFPKSSPQPYWKCLNYAKEPGLCKEQTNLNEQNHKCDDGFLHPELQVILGRNRYKNINKFQIHNNSQ